jgi:hypothetical protein
MLRSMTTAADRVLPPLMAIADAGGDILGSVSSFGSGGLALVAEFAEQGAEGLATLSPLLDLTGDGLAVAAEATAFWMDTLGDPAIESFGGYVEWAAENARWLATGIYDLGSAVGIWDALAGGARLLGSGIEWAADAAGGFFDFLVGGAQKSLELLVDLHNVLNDLPQAQRVPGISAQDIEAPDLSTIGPDRGRLRRGRWWRAPGHPAGDEHRTDECCGLTSFLGPGRRLDVDNLYWEYSSDDRRDIGYAVGHSRLRRRWDDEQLHHYEQRDCRSRRRV